MKTSEATFRAGGQIGEQDWNLTETAPHIRRGRIDLGQLQAFAQKDLEFTLAFAMALGFDNTQWSPGHTRAWMSEGGVTFWSGHVGLMLGAHLQQIGVKPSWERGMYVGAIPGPTPLNRVFAAHTN